MSKLAPLEEVQAWFLENGDATGAACLRIGFGLLYLFCLWDFYPVMPLLFGHSGLYGTMDPGYIKLSDPLNLLFRFDSAFSLGVWFWASVFAALCVVLGFFSRIAVAATFISLLLFQRRGPYITYGADQVLLTCSIWLLFLDTGKRLSVDSLIRRRGQEISTRIELWPVKAIQIQVALIYLVTALTKLGTGPWKEGSALFYALQLRGVNHGLFPGLLDHKLLLSLMSYGVLCIELSFPILVFVRSTRWFALLLGICLHLGIDLLMSIRLFSLTMYFGYLSYIRPEEWMALGRIVRKWRSFNPSPIRS